MNLQHNIYLTCHQMPYHHLGMTLTTFFFFFCYLLVLLIHPKSNQDGMTSSIMGYSSLTVSLPSEGLVIFCCHFHSNHLEGMEVKSWSWVLIYHWQRPRLYGMWKFCCHSLFATAVINLIGRELFTDNVTSKVNIEIHFSLLGLGFCVLCVWSWQDNKCICH